MATEEYIGTVLINVIREDFEDSECIQLAFCRVWEFKRRLQRLVEQKDVIKLHIIYGEGSFTTYIEHNFCPSERNNPSEDWIDRTVKNMTRALKCNREVAGDYEN